MKVDHSEYVELLKAVEAVPGIKKVFIRSGIRFDYLMADPDRTFFKKLVADHVSGQLKVAPEHCSSPVLRCMGKPDFDVYEAFREQYFALSEACGKEQYLVPYLMSSHPGSTLQDAVELAVYLKKSHYAPEQVQDYYPTPGTASTVMFYTGLNPLTMKPVHVVTDYKEKQMQRALLQYNRPQNADLVREALKLAGREDLIGYGADCLVRPAGDGHFKPTPKGVKGTAPGRNAKGRGAASRTTDHARGGKATAKRSGGKGSTSANRPSAGKKQRGR
jgi:radical SAM superfamily enzyme YgiQ (UPF0313 family)